MFRNLACARGAGSRIPSVSVDQAARDRCRRGHSLSQWLTHLSIHVVPRSLAMVFLAVAVIGSRPCAAQVYYGEAAQLQYLYLQTDGANWLRNNNWDPYGTSANPCFEGWDGITCDINGTYITKIELQGNNLDGTIENFDFSVFSALEVFDISNNNVSGSVPGSLSNAPYTLTTLNISSNGFSSTLPDLSLLTSLQYLDASDNQLIGNIPALTDLVDLVTVRLGENSFSGPFPALPDPGGIGGILPGVSYLSVFDVHNNLLVGSMPSLSALSSLTSIDVSSNQLSGDVPAVPSPNNLTPGASVLCPNDFNPTSNPDWDAATGVTPWYQNCAQTVPSNIPANERQVLVDLYTSTVGGNWTHRDGWLGQPGTECDWYGVGCDDAREHVVALFLSSNNLGGELPSNLDDLTFLTQFYAGGNQLGGAIPPLTGFTGLGVFIVSGNQLSGSIPPLSALVNLRIFQVGGNQLTGVAPSVPTPNVLNRAGSSLCPNALARIPDTAWDAATGVIPWYRDCTGPTQTTIPASERQVLVDLYTSTDGGNWTEHDGWLGGSEIECDWYGVECDDAGEHVVGIRLSNNNLRGSLPPSLNDLLTLEFFQADDNGLTGAIPPLPALTALKVLDLRANQLTGPIPDLSTLTALTALSVADNQLTGPVPSVPSPNNLAPGQSTLCPNGLDPTPNPDWDAATGATPWYRGCPPAPPRIPASERQVLLGLYASTDGDHWTDHDGWLGDAGTECDWYGVECDAAGEHVVGIRLSSNNLQGSLPPGMGDLPALVTFRADDNGLTGAIPPLSALTALEALDLRANQLTGPIPDLSALTALTALSVADNQLAGPVPSVPSPNNLAPGQSTLCPNNLDPTPNPDWDAATGETPWHQDCVGSAGSGATADDGFDPQVNAAVRAMAIQPDGSILLGGEFSTMGGQERGHIGRLLPDGSVDPGFAAVVVDGDVEAVVVQPDGRIVLGGAFSAVDGQARGHLARLHADGSLDVDFNPDAIGAVHAVWPQADGKLVLAGDFPKAVGAVRSGITRLHVDGDLDTGFQVAIEGVVTALVQQPDGRIVIGGAFDHVNGEPRWNLARLEADGTLDPSFAPDPNGAVHGLVRQPDGRIIAGGEFTSISGQAIAHLARLREDASADESYAPQPDAPVRAMLLQADGRLLVGGDLTRIAGQPRDHIARLNFDGSLDPGFDPGAEAGITAFAQQADGKVVVAGDFTRIGGQELEYLARLYPDGGLDRTLATAADRQVEGIMLQPDGGIVVAGNFDTVAGQARRYLARIHPDGDLDADFDAKVEGGLGVLATAALPDGGTVIAGSFSEVGGQAAGNIARLQSDGSADAAFAADTNAWIGALAVRPDGRLLIAGDFSTVNGEPRAYVAGLNADGSLDASFDAIVDGPVHALLRLPDGKLVIGGGFTSVDGVAQPLLARLNADGSLDPTFDAQITVHGQYDAVHTLLRQADGKLVIGGSFESVGGQDHYALARVHADGAVDADFQPQLTQLGGYPGTVLALALRADGKLLVAGGFDAIDGVARTNIARLAADGSVDGDWEVQPYLSPFVGSLALQTDGKLLLGGDFAGIGGRVRDNLARIATPEAALQSLQVVVPGNGAGVVTWARSGAAPELAQPPLLLSSTDGTNFTAEGTMQYHDGIWRFDDFVPPPNRNFWLRTQARASSGRFNGSSGMVQSTRQAYVRRDVLDVENVVATAMAGRMGWRFDLVNAGPHRARDVQILLDATEAMSIAFLPACTMDASGGTVVVRCERPSELGISCDNSGDAQRHCSIANLPPGQSYAFFLVPTGPDVTSISATILANGMVVEQHSFTP